jgi:hypothetical protein
MTTTSVDVESFSDTVSPDALEAIERKGTNKPDISRLPDAIVGGVGLIMHEVIYINTDESILRGAGAQFASIARRLRHRAGDAT